MSKWAKVQRDKSHLSIANELRQRGFSVCDLAGVGDDVPDLLVANWQFASLVEVKEPSGAFDVTQLEYASTWKGNVMFAQNADEIVEAFRVGKFLTLNDKDRIAVIALKVRATSKAERPRLAVSKFAKLMQVC